jgi:hypothetical protein
LLELSITVEEKADLPIILRIVETKACDADRTHLRRLEREAARGCMELRES